MVAGKVFRSKTLSKIGAGFSLAGAAGSVASGFKGGASASSASTAAGEAARSADLSTTEGLLASKTPGVKDVISDNAFKSFNPTGQGAINSVSGLADSASDIGAKAGDFATEPSLFERFSRSNNRYSTTMQIVGGIGQAVVGNQQVSMQNKQRNKDRDFQREVDARNYAGTSGALPDRNVSFNPASRGLLRGGTTISNVIPQR